MNKKKIILGLFSILVVVQIIVPVSMIMKREDTLRNGTRYLFRTKPVDPYDAFRGRYVALGFEQDAFPQTDTAHWVHGQYAYAILKKDEHGFATIDQLTHEPAGDDTYIKVKTWGVWDNKVHLRFPFDRYYMEETHAPQAEKAYRDHSQREEKDAYVSIRVKNGFAVLEELYIAGMPIIEFLENNKGKGSVTSNK